MSETERARIEAMARRAREAARTVGALSTEQKNVCLLELARQIELQAAALRSANEQDLAVARTAGLPDAKLRRLTLSDVSIGQLSEGLRQIAHLPDPVGQVTKDYRVPSGLHVRKVRCPLGVILMIYEARPNVTVDAFALCFKAGNACLLKGGHEARCSNEALRDLVCSVLSAHGVPPDALGLLTVESREELRHLLTLSQDIDLVIPRGGVELIRFVRENSWIPTVQHFQGVCHIFVDASANLNQAIEICATAKTSAPAACNAVETILVHEEIAGSFVPALVTRLAHDGVEVRGDVAVCRLAPAARRAADADWGCEFLDLIVALKVVPDLDAAIAHIQRFGSSHTEAILTNDQEAAQRFVTCVQSSCTLVNASTRFNDGFQLGLGAEIGISTSRIHAYGPMGLEELTIQRYIVDGQGQTR